MTDLDLAEVRRRASVDRCVHCEAVIVRVYLDLAGRPVEHRLVDAAVPVAELVGAETERAAEDLMAEADTEDRKAIGEQLPDADHGDVGGGRVARAVREEHRIGAGGPYLRRTRGRRQHVRGNAPLSQAMRCHRLDSVVERRDRDRCTPMAGTEYSC